MRHLLDMLCGARSKSRPNMTAQRPQLDHVYGSEFRIGADFRSRTPILPSSANSLGEPRNELHCQSCGQKHTDSRASPNNARLCFGRHSGLPDPESWVRLEGVLFSLYGAIGAPDAYKSGAGVAWWGARHAATKWLATTRWPELRSESAEWPGKLKSPG